MPPRPAAIAQRVLKRFIALLIFLLLYGCGEDYATAKKVSRYLDATDVVPTDTREASATHKGKMVYVGPGGHGCPHFIYYEITSSEDIEKLRRAAEQALNDVPEAQKITLHFKEKQVWHESKYGGSRGREKTIEKIVVKRK